MYSLFTTNGPASVSQGNVVYGKGLSDMMDKFLVLRRNQGDLAPGTEVILSNALGRTLRKFVTPKAAQLPILKLSDAMIKALHSDDNAVVGLPGAPITLKALESRGLVKRDNVGVAHLTDLGRQYRRV